MLPAPMLQPMLAAGCSHTITCASCPLWSSVRGCARGPASMHCMHGKRVRHDRGGREIHRQCSCADLPDAKAFGASPGRLQHETCSTASEGPCGRCIRAQNRHARAVRQHDRHGIQLGEHPLTTCRQPHCCSSWPRARCSRANTCASCPGSARSRVSRCSAAHCMLGCCSFKCQTIGGVGRCIRLGAGASCTIPQAFGLLAPAPEERPPHAPSDPS